MGFARVQTADTRLKANARSQMQMTRLTNRHIQCTHTHTAAYFNQLIHFNAFCRLTGLIPACLGDLWCVAVQHSVLPVNKYSLFVFLDASTA